MAQRAQARSEPKPPPRPRKEPSGAAKKPQPHRPTQSGYREETGGSHPRGPNPARR